MIPCWSQRERYHLTGLSLNTVLNGWVHLVRRLALIPGAVMEYIIGGVV